MSFFFFFFFQAEDGIRDYKVTGVQTCALPISARSARPIRAYRLAAAARTPCSYGHRRAERRAQRRFAVLIRAALVQSRAPEPEATIHRKTLDDRRASDPGSGATETRAPGRRVATA